MNNIRECVEDLINNQKLIGEMLEHEIDKGVYIECIINDCKINEYDNTYSFTCGYECKNNNHTIFENVSMIHVTESYLIKRYESYGKSENRLMTRNTWMYGVIEEMLKNYVLHRSAYEALEHYNAKKHENTRYKN